MHQYTFRWTFDDHVRAQRQVIRHMMGGAWLKALPVAAAALLLAVIIDIFVLGTESRSQAAFTALPYVLILVLVLFVTRFGTPWLAARRVQRDDPSVKGDIKHIVSDRGLAISGVAATIEFTWDHIRQVVETPDFFLYYYSPKWAYFTPKRVIPPLELPSLRVSLRAYLGSRARLLGGSAAAA